MSRYLFYLSLLLLVMGAKYVTVGPNITVFKAVFALALLLGLFAPSGVSKGPPPKFLLAFVAFSLFLLISVRGAPTPSLGYTELYQYLACLAGAWGAFVFLHDARHFKGMATVLVWAGALNAVLGILQVLVGARFYVFSRAGAAGRAAGFFANPNGLGGLLVLTFFLCIALSHVSKPKLRRLYLWGFVPLMLVGCILSFSRSALLAVVAGLAVYALRIRKMRGSIGMLVFLAVLVGVAYWVLSLGMAGVERWEYGNIQGNIRWLMMERALVRFAESPLLGHGAYGYVVKERMVCHVAFLVPLVEQGALGWVAYMFLVGGALVEFARAALKNVETKASWFFWAFACGYGALMFHTNLHGGGYRSTVMWLLLGVGFRALQLQIGHPARMRFDVTRPEPGPTLATDGVNLASLGRPRLPSAPPSPLGRTR